MERVHRKVAPKPALFQTYESITLPRYLIVLDGGMHLPVRSFVSQPKQCFHWRRFGHIDKCCRRKHKSLPAVCTTCGGNVHEGCCTVHCLNWGGNHAASSKECVHFQFEKELLAVPDTDRVSILVARKRFLARSPGRESPTHRCSLRLTSSHYTCSQQSVQPQSSAAGSCGYSHPSRNVDEEGF